MHYLLFLPGVSAGSRAALESCGLGTLIRADEADPVWYPLLGPGPGGQLGSICLPHLSQAEDRLLHNPRGGYFPDQQTWKPSPCGRYWVGIEQRPTPASLRRQKTVAGGTVVLGDGQAWEVPCWFARTHHVGVDAAGAFTLRERHVFDAEYDRASRFMSMLESLWRGDETAWDFQTAAQYAVDCLVTNYRLNAVLIDCLQLLTEPLIHAVIAFSADLERLRQIQIELRSGNPTAASASPS